MNKFKTEEVVMHTNKITCNCGNTELSAVYIRDKEQKPIEVIIVCNKCLSCEKISWEDYNEIIKVV